VTAVDTVCYVDYNIIGYTFLYYLTYVHTLHYSTELPCTTYQHSYWCISY